MQPIQQQNQLEILRLILKSNKTIADRYQSVRDIKRQLLAHIKC